MGSAIRFAIAYALYAAVVLGYAYCLSAHLAGALLAPSAPSLMVVATMSLALPPLDAAGWRLLRLGRVGKATTLVVLVGMVVEFAAEGGAPALSVIYVAVKYFAYLVVLIIAAALYSLVYVRQEHLHKTGYHVA